MRAPSAALALAAVALAVLAPGARAATPVPCDDGAANECLAVTVPLDPSGAVGGEIDLHVERLGAVERRKVAILFVPGGPGQAGSPFLRSIVEEFKDPAATRDILVYDPRGTGKSGGVRCDPLPESADALAANIASCEQRLAATAGIYTTAAQVSDIEQIRRALGIERLLLYGVSFGTRAASAYAAAYPDHTEALILDSPVATSALDPFRRQVLRALPGVVREACSGSCQRATTDAGGDLIALATRTDRRPLAGYVVSPTGQRRAARLTSADLVQLAARVDVDPVVDAELPSTMRSARAA